MRRTAIRNAVAIAAGGLLGFGTMAGADTHPLGLTVENGTILRGGEPYRAMGINYHNCFSQILADPENRDFVEGFRILTEEYGIPYIRFMAGPYAHQGWHLYLDDPEEYFRRMDRIVHEAEKRNLGLIPSLFWYVVTVPDLMDEPVSELGNRESASRDFIRRYTRDFVSRYKNSPAIWGWEVGNEWMLAADLPQLNHLPRPKIGSNQPRTAEDKLFRPMILDVYEEFHKVVREIDPHRIVVTGDSIARAHAWHNRNHDRWGQDTREQWFELFAQETPEMYETVSFHMYAEMDGKYFKGEDVPLEELVRDIVAFCRARNLAIWCGELGMPGNDPEARVLFERMMRIVEENEIELSAIWNFIPHGRYQGDWDISPVNERRWMLDAVRELNKRFGVGLDTGKAPPGLTVRDGRFFREGTPYYGIGINYFDAFSRKLFVEDGEPDFLDRSYRPGFATLVRHDIPFIRFAAGGFYPNDWQVYLEDPDLYFSELDQFVADAEKAGLGLIPSLFWFFSTIPDVVGEPLDQWGNPESQTHAFMRRHTREVVSRYVDSPAIWAWEFGNEYIHEADLPPPELGRGWIVPHFGTPEQRTERDKMFRKNIHVAYRAFVDAVREIDSHRPVFSGDTMPRPTAWHNFTRGAWGIDTPEQWEEVFLRDNEDMCGLSAHFYYYDPAESHQDGGVMGFGPVEQMALLSEISRTAGKPLWIGEFGPSPREKTVEEERRQFEKLLAMIVEHCVPLSALWNFDLEHEDQVHWNIREDNHRAYMLKALRTANRILRERCTEQGGSGAVDTDQRKGAR